MTDTTTTSRPATSSTGHDTRPPSVEQMRELTAGLDPDEVRVLLHHGTERPFCGTLLDNKKTGTYRSEEHTSELQSLMRSSYAVFCLKKNRSTNSTSQLTLHKIVFICSILN